MITLVRWSIFCAVGICMLLSMNGCTTSAAKKAMNKPDENMRYSGFDNDEENLSDRGARKNQEPVSDEMKPEDAVNLLVDHLTRSEHHYSIPAEGQLRYWGTKQGVPEIIVQRVRMLLKGKRRIEVRAPALRLTILYGKRESIGDLIEVLADPEYGMRSTSFKALKAKTGRDFGYNPSAGQLARVKAIQHWRLWWQKEQRSQLASSSGIPEIERGAPPTVINRENTKNADHVLEGKIETKNQAKSVSEEIILPNPEEDPTEKDASQKTAQQQ